MAVQNNPPNIPDIEQEIKENKEKFHKWWKVYHIVLLVIITFLLIVGYILYIPPVPKKEADIQWGVLACMGSGVFLFFVVVVQNLKSIRFDIGPTTMVIKSAWGDIYDSKGPGGIRYGLWPFVRFIEVTTEAIETERFSPLNITTKDNGPGRGGVEIKGIYSSATLYLPKDTVGLVKMLRVIGEPLDGKDAMKAKLKDRFEEFVLPKVGKVIAERDYITGRTEPDQLADHVMDLLMRDSGNFLLQSGLIRPFPNIIDEEADYNHPSKKPFIKEAKESLQIKIEPFDLPDNLTDALTSKVIAHHKKETAIIDAEGKKQADILIAEGKKQADILDAGAKKYAAEIMAKLLKRDPNAREVLAFQATEALANGPGNNTMFFSGPLVDNIRNIMGSSQLGGSQSQNNEILRQILELLKQQGGSHGA